MLFIIIICLFFVFNYNRKNERDVEPVRSLFLLKCRCFLVLKSLFFFIVLHGVYVLGFKVAFVFMDCYYKNLIEYQKKTNIEFFLQMLLVLNGSFRVILLE